MSDPESPATKPPFEQIGLVGTADGFVTINPPESQED